VKSAHIGGTDVGDDAMLGSCMIANHAVDRHAFQGLDQALTRAVSRRVEDHFVGVSDVQAAKQMVEGTCKLSAVVGGDLERTKTNTVTL